MMKSLLSPEATTLVEWAYRLADTEIDPAKPKSIEALFQIAQRKGLHGSIKQMKDIPKEAMPARAKPRPAGYTQGTLM